MAGSSAAAQPLDQRLHTPVVRIFPNAAACLRLVTALCVEQSEEWLSGRRYLDLHGLCSIEAVDDLSMGGTGDGCR